MKALIAIFMAAAIMTGCANSIVPTTGTERYVVADAAFKALLGTINEAAVAGRIKVEYVPRIKSAILSAKIALDAWAVAPDSLNAETTALLALQAARTLLLSLEAGSVVILYTRMETLS